MSTDDEPIRLDELIEALMEEEGLTREEAERGVRNVCQLLDLPATEVGHA